VRKIVADTNPFTITKAHFKSTVMEELQSPPDHLKEGKIDYKSSKGYNSSTNERVTCPMKNKRKEKVVENFGMIRYHVKP